MKDESKTREQLIKELAELRQWVTELEASETKRKQTEKALRESEGLLRAIAANYPSYFSIIEKDLTIGFTSGKEFVKQNLDPESFVGLTLKQVFGEQALTVKQNYLKAFAGEDVAFELHLNDQYLLCNVTPLYDEHGAIPRILAVIENITERNRVEQALRESEERYRTVIEDQTEIICRFRPDGTYVFVNDVYCRFFDKSREELLDRPWHPDAYPEDVSDIEEKLATLSPGNPVLVIENRVYDGKGQLRWMQFVNRGFFDAQGTLVETQSVGRDITERKRAEEALRASEERFRSLVQTAPSVVLYLSPDGRILEFNPEAERLYGQKREVVLGQNYLELFLPKGTREPVLDDIKKVLVGEPTRGYENPIKAADGSERVLTWNVDRLLDDQGRSTGIVAVGQDITKRKQAEERLKEYSERLEEIVEERTQELRGAQEQLVRREKLAVLGRLAGGVAHELRNPLGVISSAVYYLQMVLGGTEIPAADEKIREYLEIISTQVRNATKIVSDLLDFSRTQLAEREEVAVSDFIAQTLERHPPPEDVQVTIEVAPDLPVAFIDPRQIEQVLVNLVTNAYQAMPDGGEVKIRAQAVADQVRISITDTGHGISEENMSKLFEPLFTTKTKGIGLGLSISKTLVEANEGSIEVKSKVGEGSTFTVRLPVVGDQYER